MEWVLGLGRSYTVTLSSIAVTGDTILRIVVTIILFFLPDLPESERMNGLLKVASGVVVVAR
jgi:hypothetical protein